MNKYINLIIGGLIYFVPPSVMYYFIGNNDKSVMMIVLWLCSAWALSLWVIYYLEN